MIANVQLEHLRYSIGGMDAIITIHTACCIELWDVSKTATTKRWRVRLGTKLQDKEFLSQRALHRSRL